mgnify:CR=1 FL=1
MTGSSWRHVSAFWPFMLPGAAGPRDSHDPCTSLLDGAPVSPDNRSFRAQLPVPSNATSSESSATDSDSDGGWQFETGPDAADPVAPLATMGNLLPGPEVARSHRYLYIIGKVPLHDAEIEPICLAARLGGALFGDNIGDTTSITEGQIKATKADATTLGVDYM